MIHYVHFYKTALIDFLHLHTSPWRPSKYAIEPLLYHLNDGPKLWVTEPLVQGATLQAKSFKITWKVLCVPFSGIQHNG